MADMDKLILYTLYIKYSTNSKSLIIRNTYNWRTYKYTRCVKKKIHMAYLPVSLSKEAWPLCWSDSVKEAWPLCLSVTPEKVWPLCWSDSVKEACPICLSITVNEAWLLCSISEAGMAH